MNNDEPKAIKTLPEWAEWVNDRHTSIECKACRCVYTARHWSDYAGKGGRGGMIGGIPRAGCKACKAEAAEAARKALPLDAALVAGVKAHALDHYDTGGWDTIIEAFDDAELWEVIAGAADLSAAIKRARAEVGLLDERRRDIQSTAW